MTNDRLHILVSTIERLAWQFGRVFDQLTPDTQATIIDLEPQLILLKEYAVSKLAAGAIKKKPYNNDNYEKNYKRELARRRLRRRAIVNLTHAGSV